MQYAQSSERDKDRAKIELRGLLESWESILKIWARKMNDEDWEL